MALKEENLALSSGIGLASIAVSYLLFDGEHNYPSEAFDIFKDEVIESIHKPNKVTALHYYLYFFQDIEEELSNSLGGEDTFRLIFKTLEEIGMLPNLPLPDFENCSCQKEESEEEEENFENILEKAMSAENDAECDCELLLDRWKGYVVENCREIDQLIVHGAFQYLFQDRHFLHDFHIVLAKWVEENMNYIEENYPDHLVLVKKRFRRQRFPVWLKEAVFYRDKGTCVLCRNDLSNLIRTVNKIHIDHIVPLELYGTNDASNMQLLCSTCNTKKGARSTKTSNLHAPYWNLDKDMFEEDDDEQQ
ncbi:HNH endonuclease [Priestia megaterium]|uniref:HNH endonuclease n=1 Tax=Priestia megaterium TaxID=1404 RepID=UPI0030006FDB